MLPYLALVVPPPVQSIRQTLACVRLLLQLKVFCPRYSLTVNQIARQHSRGQGAGRRKNWRSKYCLGESE